MFEISDDEPEPVSDAPTPKDLIEMLEKLVLTLFGIYHMPYGF